MLRNNDIHAMMTSALMKLMPMTTKEPNPELWSVYDKLRKWKIAIEWKYPHIGTDHSAEMAEAIFANLKMLTDREWAREIEHVVRCHTLARKRKITDAGCGRVIGEWTSCSGIAAQTKGKYHLTDSCYAATPFAR